MKIFSILLIAAFMTGISFSQTNYYVDNGLGSDRSGQGTGSGSAAWKSIEYAVRSVANPTTDSIVIHVASGEYNLSNNQIDVTRNFKNLTIVGDKENTTIVEADSDPANSTSRIIQIYPGNKVTLKQLTIRYGFASMSGSAIDNDSATLNIENCLITQNTGGKHGVGGAVSNIAGILNVNNSTISYNTTTDSCYGGGIGSMNGTCNISNSTISNNNAPGGAGIAIISYKGNSVFNIINSTISENTASYFCGGIRLDRWLDTNYTIKAAITNCTIFNNTSTGQYGIGGVGVLSGTLPKIQVTIKNSIIAGNIAGTDIDLKGTIISGDYNLIQDVHGATITGDTTHNIYGKSPDCSPLALNYALNGTMTCAISSSSPAKDVIPASSPNGAPLYDQRGAPRNGNIDIGSYEYWNDTSGFPGALAVKNSDLSSPATFKLMQNYPNPFNPSTEISYSIPKSGYVKLTIYNVLGEKITELVNGYQSAGNHSYQFNANNLSSGIYFYSLQTGNLVQTKKMILLK